MLSVLAKKGALWKTIREPERKTMAISLTTFPARPLKYVKDSEGYGWLCDEDVDPNRDLRERGCWRCDEMAFPIGGR